MSCGKGKKNENVYHNYLDERLTSKSKLPGIYLEILSLLSPWFSWPRVCGVGVFDGFAHDHEVPGTYSDLVLQVHRADSKILHHNSTLIFSMHASIITIFFTL